MVGGDEEAHGDFGACAVGGHDAAGGDEAGVVGGVAAHVVHAVWPLQGALLADVDGSCRAARQQLSG